MFSSSSKKPYTAVTVDIERLTGPGYDEHDLSGIVDLIEVIRLQDSGPTEAARAIRKKLKYGDTHRQLRALTILDGLIQNAGGRFQRTFADEALLERLRLLPREHMTDPEVRDKCNALFRQWASYRSTPGLTRIASLSKQLPRKTAPTASQSKVVRDNDAEAAANPFEDFEDETPSPQETRPRGDSRAAASASTSTPPPTTAIGYSQVAPTPSSSSKKSKRRKPRAFILEKAKSNILQTIAQSSIASTNLLNALTHVNRESTRVSEDPEVLRRFETCKVLRRKVLRYIQLVESDDWIGSLLSANDELVKALMAFEVMDKSVDADSDSDVEGVGNGGAPAVTRSRQASRVHEDLQDLRIEEKPPEKPPRPGTMPAPTPQPAEPSPLASGESDLDDDDDNADENDPFGDQNAIK